MKFGHYSNEELGIKRNITCSMFESKGVSVTPAKDVDCANAGSKRGDKQLHDVAIDQLVAQVFDFGYQHMTGKEPLRTLAEWVKSDVLEKFAKHRSRMPKQITKQSVWDFIYECENSWGITPNAAKAEALKAVQKDIGVYRSGSKHYEAKPAPTMTPQEIVDWAFADFTRAIDRVIPAIIREANNIRQKADKKMSNDIDENDEQKATDTTCSNLTDEIKDLDSWLCKVLWTNYRHKADSIQEYIDDLADSLIENARTIGKKITTRELQSLIQKQVHGLVKKGASVDTDLPKMFQHYDKIIAQRCQRAKSKNKDIVMANNIDLQCSWQVSNEDIINHQYPYRTGTVRISSAEERLLREGLSHISDAYKNDIKGILEDIAYETLLNEEMRASHKPRFAESSLSAILRSDTAPTASKKVAHKLLAMSEDNRKRAKADALAAYSKALREFRAENARRREEKKK